MLISSHLIYMCIIYIYVCAHLIPSHLYVYVLIPSHLYMYVCAHPISSLYVCAHLIPSHPYMYVLISSHLIYICMCSSHLYMYVLISSHLIYICMCSSHPISYIYVCAHLPPCRMDGNFHFDSSWRSLLMVIQRHRKSHYYIKENQP